MVPGVFKSAIVPSLFPDRYPCIHFRSSYLLRNELQFAILQIVVFTLANLGRITESHFDYRVSCISEYFSECIQGEIRSYYKIIISCSDRTSGYIMTCFMNINKQSLCASDDSDNNYNSRIVTRRVQIVVVLLFLSLYYELLGA